MILFNCCPAAVVVAKDGKYVSRRTGKAYGEIEIIIGVNP